MTRTTTYIDETTGEHLSTVHRVSDQYRITVAARIEQLLRACSSTDPVPEEIAANVFFAHHCPGDGRAFAVTLIAKAQCDAALKTLARLAAAVARQPPGAQQPPSGGERRIQCEPPLMPMPDFREAATDKRGRDTSRRRTTRSNLPNHHVRPAIPARNVILRRRAGLAGAQHRRRRPQRTHVLLHDPLPP